MRPNSPLHQTMVLSSRPRSARSCKQRRHAFVHLRQFPAHGLEMLLVRVPALVVDGDVGDAALDQPPRHQAGLAEGVAAVTVAQVVLLLRQVEDLAGVAEDQVVGLLLGLLGGGQLRDRPAWPVPACPACGATRAGPAAAASEMPCGHDAFDGKPALRRVAAGGKRLVARPEEPRLGEPPLQLRQHDVRRNQPLVAGVVSLEERDHRPDARKDHPGRRAAGRSGPCRRPSRGRCCRGSCCG